MPTSASHTSSPRGRAPFVRRPAVAGHVIAQRRHEEDVPADLVLPSRLSSIRWKDGQHEFGGLGRARVSRPSGNCFRFWYGGGARDGAFADEGAITAAADAPPGRPACHPISRARHANYEYPSATSSRETNTRPNESCSRP